MKQPDNKELELFIYHLSKLGPIEFLGVAAHLGIGCYLDEEEKEAKDSGIIMGEILDKFYTLPWYQRKRLLRIIKSSRRRK